LEKWTLVLAQATGLTRDAGEGFSDFVARAWTTFLTLSPDSISHLETLPELADEAIDDDAFDDEDIDAAESAIQHEHLWLSDGSEVCPSMVYSVLSEIMHARECEDVTTWESRDLLDPDQLPVHWFVPIGAVNDALSLTLIQIGMVTAAALSHTKDYRLVAALADYRTWPHRFSNRDFGSESREFWSAATELTPPERWRPRPTETVTPSLVSLMPLTPEEGLQARRVSYLDRQRWTYASMAGGFRPAGRLYRDDELATLIFDAHRFNAVRLAITGLRSEAKKFGEEFDITSVGKRGSYYVLVSELAALTGFWCEGTVSAALKLVSSSLRSAYWLWLEDDDRAMAALRCTLEQAARIAATLKNPHRAGKMEDSLTLPSRWLEAAGWKRLKALNDALGEYAHAQKKIDPIGPRLLLTALQMDARNDPDSIMTARRHALDLVTEFAARSTIDALRTISSKIADCAVEMLDDNGPFDLSEARKEAVLNYAWEIRRQRTGDVPNRP
jgi:hypothetical protein